MYARVSTLQVSPDRIEELLRVSREQILPALQQIAGFRQVYSLLDRGSGRVVSIVLWESEQALRDSEERAAGLRQQGGQAGGASTTPAVDRYEVVVETGAAGGGDGQVARYTTGQAAPERVDELARHVREQNAPLMQRQPGFGRAYYCADRQSGRVMTVSFWQSREALRQAEAMLNQAREQATQVAGAQTPPTSEVYEVVQL